jgi:hypothetical protein
MHVAAQHHNDPTALNMHPAAGAVGMCAATNASSSCGRTGQDSRQFCGRRTGPQNVLCMMALLLPMGLPLPTAKQAVTAEDAVGSC